MNLTSKQQNAITVLGTAASVLGLLLYMLGPVTTTILLVGIGIGVTAVRVFDRLGE